MAGFGIDLNHDAANGCTSACNFKAGGHPINKSLQYALFFHSDDRIVTASHSNIRDMCSPIWEDSFVCSGDMGMRSNHCGCSPIQMPTHRHFFTGGFGVKINKYNINIGWFFF